MPVLKNRPSPKRIIIASVYLIVVLCLNLRGVQLFDGENGHKRCCEEVRVVYFWGWPFILWASGETWSYPDAVKEANLFGRDVLRMGDKERKDFQKEVKDFQNAWDARIETLKTKTIPWTHRTYLEYPYWFPRWFKILVGVAVDALVLFGGTVMILFVRRRKLKPS